MNLRQDGLNCRQCFSNKSRNKAFRPDCTFRVCRNAHLQYKEVEAFVSFWQMLRVSESFPREMILKDLGLAIEDYELFAALDSEYNLFQKEEREKAQNERSRSKGFASGGGSFGRR